MRIYSYESLQTSEEKLINLGRLPDGKYTYHLAILNPFKHYFEIDIGITGKAHRILLIMETSEKKNINLPFEADSDKETIIRLQLKKGEFLFIKPAVCPQIYGDIEESLSHSLLVPDMVNSFFVQEQTKREAITEAYKPFDIYARVFKEVQLYNSVSVNSFSKSSEIFYEFIDMETSKKQLDYVIFHKMLTEKKGSFFKRITRKLARKIFITIYKSLTCSENRKNYIAKLYRNYINMNYLSERKNK